MTPTSKIDDRGTKIWRLNGLLHNNQGPAVLGRDGYEGWWNHGQLHRLDGPAIKRRDGHKEWWCYGMQIKPHLLNNAEILTKLLNDSPSLVASMLIYLVHES